MVKKLSKWVHHKLNTNFKNHSFEVFCLIIHKNKPFLNLIVMYDEKWVLYDNQQQTIQWLDWEETPKYFPKPNSNLHQKRSWSLFGGLLPIRSTTAFWILVKLLHLRSMLSKLMRCRWKPQFFNRIGPILHNNARPHVTQPFLKMNDAPQSSLKFYLQ